MLSFYTSLPLSHKRILVTSHNDVTIVCSIDLVGKALHMCRQSTKFICAPAGIHAKLTESYGDSKPRRLHIEFHILKANNTLQKYINICFCFNFF